MKEKLWKIILGVVIIAMATLLSIAVLSSINEFRTKDIKVDNIIQTAEISESMVEADGTLAAFITYQFKIDGKTYKCKDEDVSFYEFNDKFIRNKVKDPIFASTESVSLWKDNSIYYCYLLYDGNVVFSTKDIYSSDFIEVGKMTDIIINESIVGNDTSDYEKYTPIESIVINATYVDNEKYYLKPLSLMFKNDGKYYKAPDDVTFYSENDLSEEHIIQNPVFISPMCRTILYVDGTERYCYLTATGNIVYSDGVYDLKEVYE